MPGLADNNNLVLIGMPGVGKSTVGVLLAKYTSRSFMDTDVYIQAGVGKRLCEIISEEGINEFRRIEEQHILSLHLMGHVIATGGSVVYSDEAMQHLKQTGIIVHLQLTLNELEKRLSDLDERGVVRAPGQTLEQLYIEREPLYLRYADFTIICDGLSQDQTVDKIIATLGNLNQTK